MKFAGGQNVGAPGALLHDVVDSIRIGWNLVGTIGFPVVTSSITPGGGVVLSSAFYDYNGTYHTTTTLKPGQGFWVKASAPGTLTINGGVPVAEPKNTPSTNFASGGPAANRTATRESNGRTGIASLLPGVATT